MSFILLHIPLRSRAVLANFPLLPRRICVLPSDFRRLPRRITMDRGRSVVFTVRVIHSLPLRQSVVQLYHGDRMMAISHLIGSEQLPGPNQVPPSNPRVPGLREDVVPCFEVLTVEYWKFGWNPLFIKWCACLEFQVVVLIPWSQTPRHLNRKKCMLRPGT